ncbi:hypothetical protein G210_5817 [Candida maltosa Xu316]|uniref:DNA repair metallo-beta-lactamase domain-containing protein n=1 Tax=Candida maltosa (strain Xu316) TaxID=1245528 RepID=M3K3S4_CANMX|nr:hypothetical protein G210_5817 [Candida maltosa Xu316]
MSSGNTFHGEIYEFPGIFVDKFNVPGEAFLLTHSHQDHLQGLLNKSFCSKVYCSELTKSVIALDQKYKHILPFLIPKKYNEPFEITTFLCRVTVTLIPSYHCPGSVMFLLEGSQKSVLATGDIRAEQWWVSSLVKNTYLFPYITGLKKLEQIYLDTTFSYRGEPYISIMPNSEGIHATIELLKLYPIDDEIQFSFLDSVSGAEEAWFQIVNYFDGELLASDYITQRIELLKKYREFYSPLKTAFNNTGPTFNVGNMQKKVPIMIIIKHTINFNVIDYASNCLPRKLSDIKPGDMKCLMTTTKGHKLYEHDGRQWLLPKWGTELLPTGIMLMFSRHSSYEETRNFVELFRPKSVYPCTESRASWLNGFTVDRIFGDLCTSTDVHRFDTDKFKKYGYPLPKIVNREVGTVNRWSFSECLDEVNFVETVFEKPFKGQTSLSPKKKLNTHKNFAWSREFKLRQLITGRNEEKFKEVVNYHQTLYANPIFDKRHDISSSYGSESTYDDVRTYSDDDDSDDDHNTSSRFNFTNNTLTSGSVFLNDKKIKDVSNTLIQDKRNWNSFQLKSTNNQH